MVRVAVARDYTPHGTAAAQAIRWCGGTHLTNLVTLAATCHARWQSLNKTVIFREYSSQHFSCGRSFPVRAAKPEVGTVALADTECTGEYHGPSEVEAGSVPGPGRAPCLAEVRRHPAVGAERRLLLRPPGAREGSGGGFAYLPVFDAARKAGHLHVGTPDRSATPGTLDCTHWCPESMMHLWARMVLAALGESAGLGNGERYVAQYRQRAVPAPRTF